MRNRPSLRSPRRWFLLGYVLTCSLASLLPAQSPPPAGSLPRAVYAPAPVYRPEWARQGLKGKGVALVTIDTRTGKVAGVRMLQSTGSSVLDGAALQAYSQWRFQPGSIAQVKMPVEFKAGPRAKNPPGAEPRGPRAYWLIFLAGFVILLTVLPRLLSRRLARRAPQ